jgi:Secretion system C-terminal sorting domain
MYKYYICFICFFLGAIHLRSQDKYGYTWIFGHDYHPVLPGGSMLDFGTVPMRIENFDIVLGMGQTAIISNPVSGKLLFYTDGCAIANSRHQKMANGDSINYSKSIGYARSCRELTVGYRANQGVIALPFPGRPDQYAMFHLQAPETDLFYKSLLVTTVNMNTPDSLGLVTEKNRIVLKDTLLADCITAVKHGNGRDWWIVVPRNGENIYHILLLSPAGVSDPVQQRIGPMMTRTFSANQATFSPNGTLYARRNFNQPLLLLAFDRCTGRFHCPKSIPIEQDQGGFTGVAFSPNSQLLYISSPGRLYQYDTRSSNAGPLLIDIYDGFENPFPARFGFLQLAPNNKIYMGTINGTYNLHTIHDPDVPGKACNFRQHDVVLPASSYFNPPNVPHFGLYDLRNSPCDSLGINTPAYAQVTRWMPETEVHIAPNPAHTDVYVSIGACEQGFLKIYNAAGQMIFERSGLKGPVNFDLSVSNWPAGIYIATLSSGNKAISVSKLVVVH